MYTQCTCNYHPGYRINLISNCILRCINRKRFWSHLKEKTQHQTWLSVFGIIKSLAQCHHQPNPEYFGWTNLIGKKTLSQESWVYNTHHWGTGFRKKWVSMSNLNIHWLSQTVWRNVLLHRGFNDLKSWFEEPFTLQRS